MSCLSSRMIARMVRLEFTMLEMVIVAVAVGLLAALGIANPVS